ncbi:NAD(P)-dependent oxidoreductase [Methyloradius palustris]|uniref:3-hydroxyisobutyrate dehydrogenase n=1 Tax=Methyloradius palustris TaxID=2778876 RepID=A0A8D5G6C9_9PROT|nr:NAD(P)-dependent oxidoreductase [Methyloradius palustris]BCM24111.1 3-hydroxyisobutyrate dehydrogenase [Methyloradius palustris]
MATIGFIGLGAMGEGMASNLLAAGYAVQVYNRSAEKIAPLLSKGANATATPKLAATGADFVITMLSNDAVLESVTLGDDGLLAGMKEGAIHLSMSTVSPDISRQLSEIHARHKTHYVTSPVFGRPEMAATKKLWICTSGNPAALAKAKPVQEAMSQGIFEFGEDAGAANIVKLSGNFMIASCMEVLGEVATLAEKNGISPEAVLGMLSSTIFACPMYQRYSDIVLKQDFEPGFKMELAFKDMNLAQTVALKSATPMPFLSIVQQRMLSGIAEGRAQNDWSALSLSARRDAGLPLSRFA